MSGSSAWLFIAGAYGVGLLLLAVEAVLLLRRSRRLRGSGEREDAR